MNTIVLLGRHGDIVNLLPLAHKLEKCNWIVGAEFAKLFEGVSYVNAIPYMRGPNHFQEALKWAAEQKLPGILPAQVFMNDDKERLTPSYAMEAWRLAKHLLDYGSRPLIFDQRDPVAEEKLIKLVRGDLKRPVVLVATRSMSSPFPKIPELLARLRGLNADIVDMGYVKANRIYDMIGLLDTAACLVTVDTLHLHLARASYCPTVAIINDGWCGSLPPPQAQYVHRYQTGSLNLDGVIRDVQIILERQRSKDSVCMAVDRYDVYPRTSKTELKDDRSLPYMKDVIQFALSKDDGEIVVWTNSDTEILDMDSIKEHAKKWNFGCVRRSPDHIGRECFWFRRQWLQDNLSAMPDVVLAAPKCDLVIAKWLRSFFGLPSSLESMSYDFPPVDLPAGIVYHEPHQSSWILHQNSPSAIHNDRLWKMNYDNRPVVEEPEELTSPSLRKASVTVDFPNGGRQVLYRDEN